MMGPKKTIYCAAQLMSTDALHQPIHMGFGTSLETVVVFYYVRLGGHLSLQYSAHMVCEEYVNKHVPCQAASASLPGLQENKSTLLSMLVSNIKDCI